MAARRSRVARIMPSLSHTALVFQARVKRQYQSSHLPHCGRRHCLPPSVVTRAAGNMDVFTPEEDEKFIHLVSQYPILYDTKHVDFKELHMKDNIWKDISKELNKTDYTICKRHWRNIRDGYARFKKCKSATSENKHPRSKWQFYKLLTFLDGVAQDKSEANYAEEFYRNESESQDNTSFSVEAEFVSMDTLHTTAGAIENNATTSAYLGNDRKRRRMTPDSTNLDSLLNYFKRRDETRLSLANKNKDNDVGSFSSHVKDVLTKLPPVLQIKAKKDIFDVLFRYELMALQQSKSSDD